MPTTLVMPKLGLTMEEGLVQEWVASPGASFRAGDVLLVVETDKIANEIQAVADGTLEEILVPEGETVACGTPIATWRAVDGTNGAAPGPSQAAPASPPDAARIIATPYARKLALQLGVDLRAVRGSGPGGRVKGPDVREAAAAQPAAPATAQPAAAPPPSEARQAAAAQPTSAPAERRPATRFEQTTAARMTAAKQVPHFYLSTEVDVAALEALRGQLNALPDKPRISVTHLLVAALARTLVDHPEANRVWDDGHIVQRNTVDVGLAVATPRGLLAPVLRDLGGARIHEVAERCRALVQRARDHQLTPDDLGGGATSVSNAGMHDVTYMSSIITPGQSSIFGVGSVRQVFRPDEAGRPVLRRELGIVMSCDHRIFDGVGALAVLNRLKSYLESPLQVVI